MWPLHTVLVTDMDSACFILSPLYSGVKFQFFFQNEQTIRHWHTLAPSCVVDTPLKIAVTGSPPQLCLTCTHTHEEKRHNV